MLAFNTFHLSRFFVFDGDMVMLAMAVSQERFLGSPRKFESNASAMATNTSTTMCFVPPQTTEEALATSVAPFLSAAAFSELSAWVHRWWGDGDGVWWLAQQTEYQPLRLSRMDNRLRPMLKAPLCLSESRVKYVNVGKDERGAVFQVLDCQAIPSACAASAAAKSRGSSRPLPIAR
jgi:hypothetical protein